VDRVAAGASRDLDDPRGVEVARARRRAADGIRGVRRANVKCVAVDVAVDGDRAEAQIVTRADDAERDLAAIRDEDGPERRRA
jgi:hypothetical protein